MNIVSIVLDQKIRENDRLEGVVIAAKNKIHAQYADDLWAIIPPRQKIFDELIKKTGKFLHFQWFKNQL